MAALDISQQLFHYLEMRGGLNQEEKDRYLQERRKKK
jgi:hypothetical protein